MNNYYLLISWITFILCAWEQELTTEVIQKYHAPNSLIHELRDVKIKNIQKCENYYIKPDISRIIGVERLKSVFAHSHYDHFKTPEKFIIPFFDKKGRLQLNKSFVVSSMIHADFLKNMSEELVNQLIDITNKSEVFDFAQRNMLQDNEETIWFIDTQLIYKSNYLSAAAEAILDSHYNFLCDGYYIPYAAQKKLLKYVSSPISQRRFKDLPSDTQPFDYE